MTLSELTLKRPVLAIVLSLTLVVLGLVSLRSIAVREYPAVDPPVVTVTTLYTGAAPEVMDATVTEPLEEAINGVPGIRSIASTSREGQSILTVEFELETDLSEAANDVRDKVAQARRNLPTDVDPPIVEKADANASPIMYVTLSSDSKNMLEVTHTADAVVKSRLETIPGVASVRIFGEKRYSMRLLLDPERMAAHDVVPEDVAAAVARDNVDLPAGRIEGTSTEVGIRADSRLHTPEEFHRMTIRTGGERPVVFEDVGRAELQPEDQRTAFLEIGSPLVGIAVIPQPNSNAIAIADEFARRLPEIERVLPDEYEMVIGYDFTVFVRRSIAEVQETLLIAFLLVAFVIFLFLGDWRTTVVPVVAIPVSIVASFFVAWVAGFSVNILTLVALVLAIGLVCDDAIVVLENIYSKVERGMPPREAAEIGSREVFFAVVATTVALVAVFLPVAFLEGLTGRLFREFGILIAASVAISSFVALSLSPVLCRYLLRNKPPNAFQRAIEPVLTGLTRGYEWTLRRFMRVRWVALVLVAVSAGAGVVLFRGLPRELAPLEDRSNVRIGVRAPEGATFGYTAKAMTDLAHRLKAEVPEIDRTYSIVARRGEPPNTGVQPVYLVEPEERTRSQQEIFEQVSAIAAQVPELRAFVGQPPTIGNRFAGQPIQFVIQAPDLPRLLEVLPGFLDAARKRPELRFIDADLRVNRPEVRVTVDRARAADLGISPLDVSRALQLSFSERRVGYFFTEGDQYQVLAALDAQDRNEPLDVAKVHLRADSGELVALDQLVTFSESTAPTALYRFNRYVSATISGSPGEGHTLGDSITALDEVAKHTLPEGFSTALTGEARELADSSSSLGFAFLLALLFAFLALAAQFDSFRDPLIVFFSVPLAMTGAFAALALTGMSLNVFSQIGLIMLVGLVTKNGILVVEFANQQRELGLDRLEAAIQAASARLRPVLMTALSTILGVLPIALSLGASAGSRQSLGIAVVGGLAFGTVLTLYVVPAMYSYLAARTRGADEPTAAPPSSDLAPTPGE
ncbi:MAG: efflux RND transporter permease subunit [Polyangiaceae bacterium]